MVERAHIDIESFSGADIKAVGAYKYAEHKSTHLWCLSFKFGKGPKHVWLVPWYDEFDVLQTWPQDLVDRIIERVEASGGFVYNGPFMPGDLKAWIELRKPLAAHNAGFERTMMNGRPGSVFSIPRTEIEQWTCTAVKSRANGLPGALGDVANALGTHKKDQAGRNTMLQVCRPKKASKADPATKYTPLSAPDKFFELVTYNLDDVEAEYGVDEAVPDLPAAEVHMYGIDQRINDRGVAVDLQFIDDVMYLIDERKKELERACRKLTDAVDPVASLDSGTVVMTGGISPTQREKIAGWIRDNGWPQLLDMQAETVKALLENPKVPDHVKKLLKIYSTYGMKAVAKYEVMRDAACADGRIRGMFIMNGAGPGRWSSVLVQLQNMARPKIKDVDVAIEAIKTRNLEWIKALYPDVEPMVVFASCTRGALVAGPGKKLIALDFAGIESRVGAWLAGEHWKLRAFEAYDKIVGKDAKGKAIRGGPDTYSLAYSRAFQVPVGEITKDDPRRQVGKVMELALGYEGGVGAFITMTKTYGIKLEELTEAVSPLLPADIAEEAEWLYEHSTKELDKRTFIAVDGVKRLWRRAHPKIVALWTDIRDAMYQAVKNPGMVYSIPNKKLMFCVKDRWLQMKLPSGRRIKYFEPEIYTPKVKCKECDGAGTIGPCETFLPKDSENCCENCEGEGSVDGRPIVTYLGTDTKTRRRMRISTYGGKGLENGDQGFSNCLLRNGMVELENEGLPIILTIHDEAVIEVDANDEGAYKLAEECMARRMKPYAEGLPIAVEGWEGPRFRK